MTGTSDDDNLIGNHVRQSVTQWIETDVDDEDFGKTLSTYNKNIRRKVLFIFSIIIAIIILTIYSLSAGRTDVGFVRTYELIWAHITNEITDPIMDYLVINVRMPRVVGGLFAGAGLAVCGTVMQSVLKNPLADSYTTGISSGASLGATLVITLGLSTFYGSYTLVIFAFIFSIIPISIIILISKASNTSSIIMIMAGIGVMYIFNAFTTVLKLWADPDALASVYSWEVGTLEIITYNDLGVIIPLVTIAILVMLALGGKINILATGDDNAKAMGINSDRLRIICLLITGLLAATIVSFTGIIGFVGLVAPHICRMVIGSNNKYLIPASALFGAFFLVLGDLVGRALLGPITLQVGVVMSFVGGPLFLWLILRKSNRAW